MLKKCFVILVLVITLCFPAIGCKQKIKMKPRKSPYTQGYEAAVKAKKEGNNRVNARVWGFGEKEREEWKRGVEDGFAGREKKP
jgi:hypothetical protein